MTNHPAYALLRTDAQTNLRAVAQHLALCASWETHTTRPTWQALTARTGLSRRTVARHLAWLQAHQLLVLVEKGTTPELSPGVLQAGPHREQPGNTASVYMLIAPSSLRLVALPRPEDHGYEHLHTGPVDAVEAASWPTPEDTQAPSTPDPQTSQQACRDEPVDTSGTPTRFGFGSKSPTRARLSPIGAGLRPALHEPVPMGRMPSQTTPEAPSWDLGSTPAGRKDRLAAAAALQAQLPVLGRISTAYLASLTREFFLAGWTPRDLLTALGTRPDATPWRHSHDIRHVPGWTRHRLAPWRTNPADPTSTIGPSPTERARAAAAHQRATARARAEAASVEHTALRATATPPPAAFTAARAQLRASRSSAGCS